MSMRQAEIFDYNLIRIKIEIKIVNKTEIKIEIKIKILLTNPFRGIK